MKRLLFLLWTGWTLSLQAVEPTVATLPEAVQARMEFLNPDYLIYPATDREEARPLLIFLHGAGGKGKDLGKVAKSVGRFLSLMEETVGKERACWVVAPQCGAGTAEQRGIWLAEDLDAFLAQVKKRLPVDPDRIYLMGNSMGGYGSWMWAAHSPQHFAAVAPVVGGLGQGGPTDVTPDLDQWAEALIETPVWAFHGAQDRVVPAERSERMVRLIRDKGGELARLTIYPEEGHGAGVRVFSSAEFYDWLFRQVRRDDQP